MSPSFLQQFLDAARLFVICCAESDIMRGDSAVDMANNLKKRNMAKRVPQYIAGLIVLAFGISLVIKADVGVAPGSVIAYAVSLLTPLSVGMSSSLFHIFCVLLQAVIKRHFSPKLLLQFPLAYAFGMLLDLFLRFMNFGFPGIMYRIITLIAGTIIIGFGIRTVVGADIILAPPDALARTLGDLMRVPMSRGKLVFDIIATAVGLLLTLIFAGNAFLAANWGTVICAVATGPIIGLFTRLIPALDIADKV